VLGTQHRSQRFVELVRQSAWGRRSLAHGISLVEKKYFSTGAT